LIEVQHLTKRYGRITAVDDLTFKVERGEILGFLGPNGAGKTTTMRILTGYMPATEGKAVVAGFDVFDQPIEAKRRTGYLPETPPLYPEMTVREYLQFVARIKIKGVRASERRQRVEESMRRTRVDDMADRHCGKLSKGYRQRVGLAQAILHNPEVLILDEPTAGLDPKQIIETRQLIKELAGTHTIILSTHILPEVSQTCERVVIINKGRMVAVDTPNNLTAKLRGSETMYVQIDSSGQDASALLQALPGVTGVAVADTHAGYTGYEVNSAAGRDIRRDLARTIVSQNWGLLELRPTRMSLEDIFLSLTTEEEDKEDKEEEKEGAEPGPTSGSRSREPEPASGAEQHG
jgi:ABC-2 type transport system ATP-binding protein